MSTKSMISSQIKNSIKGWYFTESEIQSALTTAQMLNPSIDLTNACNLNCPYCYIEEKNSIRKHRKSNELSFEETLKVIDELADCGARTINIVGAGEPTVDQHFNEIIKHIHSKGITTVLFTNGILLANKPDKIDFLFKHDVSVMLKYNAISAGVQDLVAGKKGYTEKRNRALQMLIERGFNADQPTRLGLDIISLRGNLKDIPKIHRMCREKNIFPIAGDYIPTGRTENGVFSGYDSLTGFAKKEQEKLLIALAPLSATDRRNLFDELTYIDKEFRIERTTLCAYYGGGICTQIIGLYIDIEGDVWPCVARKKKMGESMVSGLLGNIRDNANLKEIWFDDTYLRSLRENFDGACPYKAKLETTNIQHHEL